MSIANVGSTKTCFKCGKQQPRTEFYRHNAMSDGLLGKCKTCTKADATKHRADNIERVRAYDRLRGKNKDRIAASVEQNRRWRAEDSRRVSAHSAVTRALRSGRLTKEPCSVCGSEQSLAHHENYDKPLDVVWYCQVHHKERHKQMAIDGIDT